MANIKILLADDHKIVRDGIKLMLEPQAGIDVVAEAEDGAEVLKKLEEHVVDLVVMDINMPGIGGLETTRRILQRLPETRIIAVSMHLDEPYPTRLLASGAVG
ncbi:MAG: response regulator transcription factor, partial [Balneolaceae bacterium]|nr:response regulator transcription factor [Balneolaceae bacterium]